MTAQRGDYESAAAVADLVHPLPADARRLGDVDDSLPVGDGGADRCLPRLLGRLGGLPQGGELAGGVGAGMSGTTALAVTATTVGTAHHNDNLEEPPHAC